MDIVLGTLTLRPYVFAFLAAFLILGARDLGWRSTLVFGGWVWPVAWLSEFSSTRTGIPFGLYTYTGATRGQELFIADVPFMDALSFTFLAYASFCVARGCLGHAAPPAPVTVLGGILMMLLDVVIDPVAVRGDRWFLGQIFFYPHGGVYFGVPLSNFVGWLVVGMVGIGGYIYGWARRRGRTPRQQKPMGGIALYYAVLGFNLAVTAWIGEWVLLVIGLVLHAAVAALVLTFGRRPHPWAEMESQKA
ncbi:MAG TPA: carotenoid biosynthesis protein [Methylomirabilota bacterium]|jgi:putative membrane protein